MFQQNYIENERKMIYTPLVERPTKEFFDKLLDDIGKYLKENLDERERPEKFVLSVEGPYREAFEGSLKNYKQELENERLLSITVPHPLILKALGVGCTTASMYPICSFLLGYKIFYEPLAFCLAYGAMLGLLVAGMSEEVLPDEFPFKEITLSRIKIEKRLEAIQHLYLE